MDLKLANQVKELMERKQFSIKKLSKTSAVPYSTLRKFFSGTSDLSSDKLNRVLLSLDLNLTREINESFTNVHNLPYYMKRSIDKLIGRVS